MTLRDYLFEYIYNKGNSIEQEEVDLKEQPRMCVTLKSRRIREKER